jgi:serine/threonine protein phosphatase PrpC
MRSAIAAAQSAVCSIASPEGAVGEPPATTVVASLVNGTHAVIGWVGDSRAYLVGPDAENCQLLTHDHSWVNTVVDAGEMTEADALASPFAHAITQCLGPLKEEDGTRSPDPVPSVVELDIPPGSTLMLCSDGFWNFLTDPAQIAPFIQAQDFVSAARQMVDFANSKGGRDNITVALYRPN